MLWGIDSHKIKRMPILFKSVLKMTKTELKRHKKSEEKSSLSVGVAGFEPTTSTSQMWRDTRLRYTPIPFKIL